MINWTLWKHAFRDARWLLLGCSVTMFGFFWLFIYLQSHIAAPAFVDFIQNQMSELEGAFGLDVTLVALPRGRLSMGYVDPVVIILCAVWAIARGSDAVSGPIDRGTMEMILAQPVSRRSVLLSHVTVTVLGAAVLAVVAWAGTVAGIYTVSWKQEVLGGVLGRTILYTPLRELVSPSDFIPAAVCLFCLIFFVAGLTMLVSSCQRYRRHTIGWVGSFYVLQMVIKIVGLNSDHKWTYYFTFFGAYWPQRLVAKPEGTVDIFNTALPMGLAYNGLLFAGGLASIVAACLVFSRRDLPAPL